MGGSTESNEQASRLLGWARKKLLETFPQTNLNVNELDNKGIAIPLLLIFYAVFLFMFVYSSYENIKLNVNQKFLVPAGSSSEMICDEVPISMSEYISLDKNGEWSTSAAYEDSSSVYALKLNQAKFTSKSATNFKKQMNNFISNFKIQADRGLSRDYAWNVVLAAAYHEVVSNTSAELLSGSATFSLTVDPAVIYDQYITVLFSSKAGFCTSLRYDQPVLDSQGNLMFNFNQRYTSNDVFNYNDRYSYVYFDAPHVDHTVNDDGTAVTDDPSAHNVYDFEYSGRGNDDGRDFGYAYDDDKYYMAYDPVLVENRVCNEIFSAKLLADAFYVGASSVAISVDMRAAATAVAVNFNMIPFSVLKKGSTATPNGIRKRIGESKITANFYVSSLYDTPSEFLWYVICP